MVQKIHIVLEDDIDGGEANETVTFGLDGTSYEIDLNDKNAAALRDLLAPYVGHARKVGSTPRRGGGSGRRSAASAPAGGPSAREIRDWARANGHDVPDRGRVSAEVREAYEAAH
ncbi:histone-like nucleoid-structuring protein Lsr2 [Nocardioides pantholopis]|uniref:histone-like nucleoid-structuring protein Lsr2 n=1 Tax=Nocardioides pantholopis TaxID=2483798 RepID=UPI000FDAA96E|nr:Lsr2 family protein [Nocardioides pantholopis]